MRSGERSSKSTSASRNIDRTRSAFDKLQTKIVGRKVDLLFHRQGLEYGCCECGRYDDPTKEMSDSDEMMKIIKDMIYCLYQSAPPALQQIVIPGFLLFGNIQLVFITIIASH